jgi:16S rRNA (guanine966-N2)-methyltransferase
MRIIAGEFRGRGLRAPKGRGTRPTTDRVRESLFSAIVSHTGAELTDALVLDPFAGSGALGLEALSRGATRAVFAEKDRAAAEALEHNIDALGVRDRVRVYRADAFPLAARGIFTGPFSLILLDPPYKLVPSGITGFLGELADQGQIADGALVTWEHGSDATAEWPDGFETLHQKSYGSTRIDFAVYEGKAGGS